MNIANKLTMLRVAMIPVFVAVLYIGFTGSSYVAAAIFILASLTDYADGYIARRRGLVTDFGKFMDPLADKVLVFAAMLWFVERGAVPSWAALIVIARELAVTALRLVAARAGRVIAAAKSGKVKTALTMLCLTAMLVLRDPPGWVYGVGVAIITAATVISGAEQFYKNKDVMNTNDNK
ncbi:MAG: CDP-diacylglycerol--glycerol-3-phosphate 3-phosphatidyltransferase [Oscillospiraceae bacterium]|jgi:CDP-diacylglycerol--glycerol-3-phosphate 3-phosphatidyltransferase|nr:CDP-diacylglycerol--glycerol-3-phosphate 3-phosphatidyltransferase [Oscillospiraceae bacterium]